MCQHWALWPQYNGTYSLVLDHNTPGNSSCPLTLTASGNLIGKYTPEEYQSMSAAVFPVLTGNQYFIYSQCDGILCPALALVREIAQFLVLLN
jgi:hypothetical protein